MVIICLLIMIRLRSILGALRRTAAGGAQGLSPPALRQLCVAFARLAVVLYHSRL